MPSTINRLTITIILSSILMSCKSVPEKRVSIGIGRKFCSSNTNRVVVLPFNTSGYKGFDAGENLGENLADQYSAELMNAGYSIIERTRLNDILSEKELANVGVFNPTDTEKLLALTRAESIVLGTLVGRPNGWGITLRMVDLKTSELIWSVNSRRMPIEPEQIGRVIRLTRLKCNHALGGV